MEDDRVVLEGLPYADGGAVNVQVTAADAPEQDLRPPSELSAEEWIERMHRVAQEIHALHPNSPVLTDYEMSRESIYEDRGSDAWGSSRGCLRIADRLCSGVIHHAPKHLTAFGA